MRPVEPVSPGRADAAASYVHARITGITADIAAREPGGRNPAIYTAALRVGSTLGATRLTPGAEHAAAAWTDQNAEDALMTAAEDNGYIADHSAAAARAAIRSGLRNGQDSATRGYCRTLAAARHVSDWCRKGGACGNNQARALRRDQCRPVVTRLLATSRM